MSARSSRVVRTSSAVLLAGSAVALSGGRPYAAPMLPQAAYAIGGNSYELARADFDENGILDVAAQSFGTFYGDPFGLTLIFGRRDGRFGGMVLLPLQEHPASVATDDLDHDGHADLWAIHANARTFGVLLGRGDGTFEAERVNGADCFLGSAAAADFDSDGDLDIAVVGSSADRVGCLQVFAGNGDGSFTPAPKVSLATIPTGIRSSDVNDDGRPDLALGHFNQGLVIVLLGNGDFTFVQAHELTTGTYGGITLELNDLNEDGREDLVAASVSPSLFYELSVFPGRGDGGFGPASFTTSFEEPRGIAFADIDADGHRDMVAAGISQVVVMRGRGNGGFEELSRFELGDWHHGVLLDDLNGDGRQDLLVGSQFSEELFVLQGNGDGSFGVPTTDRFDGAAQDGAVVADFDEDGHADIAAAMIADGTVAVGFGRGDGTFGRETSIRVGASPRDAAAADFNLDGHVDLAVATLDMQGNITPADVVPGSVTVLLGGGDGTFRATGAIPVDVWPRNLSVGDANGDAIPDLAIAHLGISDFGIPGSVVVLMGLGDGTLARSASLPAGHEPGGVALADLDGDGLADLAAASRGDYYGGVPGELSLFRGHGDGTFDARTVLATGTYPNAVLAADADGDGRTDLILVDEGGRPLAVPGDIGRVTVFRGRADGTLGPGEGFGAGLRPEHAFIADLDHDGVADLGIGCYAGHVAIAGLDGSGTFAEKARLATRGWPFFIEPGDFDEDGTIDLAVVTPSGFSILRETPAVRDVVVTFDHEIGGGVTLLGWSTTGETDLLGFNAVILDPRLGRVQLNDVLIPCEECSTGLGHTYIFPVPRRKDARALYVEAVFSDGRRRLFGPARRQ